MTDTLARFEAADLTFGVVGLGYVGLPLAVEVGKAGLRVLGLDVKAEVVEMVNRGESHIQDVPAGDVGALRETGRLEATTDPSRLAECDVISICVPTPLGKTRDPDISYVLEAGRVIAKVLRPGQLVVLESTTYPGTTREVLLPLFQERGFEVGTDFFLCFSPERVDPGNPVWHTRNTPKVIGGITQACRDAGVAVYERFIDEMVPVSSPEAAEMTKLLENTFRAVNIALVNETAQIADRLQVDVWEVIEAAATKPFGFMPFYPGPGLGGHCIPVDPHYLSWKLKTLNYQARFIEMAAEINGSMPHYVVQKIADALNEAAKPVNGSRVMVIGVAYKRDVGDVRESPALDIINMLAERGAAISYHDPFVASIREDSFALKSVPLTAGRLRRADCVAIVTDHTGLDLRLIGREARLVVDARNAMKKVKKPRARVVKL